MVAKKGVYRLCRLRMSIHAMYEWYIEKKKEKEKRAWLFFWRGEERAHTRWVEKSLKTRSEKEQKKGE